MAVTIRFSPHEEEQLRAAASRAGQEVDEYTRRVVAEHLPALETTNRAIHATDCTLELLAGWDAEDATDDAEEIARREQEWEELKAQWTEIQPPAEA